MPARERVSVQARNREAEFAAFVTEWRPRLRTLAVLLHPDPELAERLVGQALVDLFRDWSRVEQPVVYACRGVVNPHRPTRSARRWDGPGLQLVDRLPAPAPVPSGVRADLSILDPPERAALLLGVIVGLDGADVAEVLDSEPGSVEELARLARRRMVEADSSRSDPAVLQAQLTAAAWPLLPETSTDVIASAIGAQRQRRTTVAAWLASAVVVAAAILVPQAQVAGRVAGSEPAPTPARFVSITPTPVPPADCDVSAPPCRSATIRRWRAQTAAIAEAHLDPKASYFSGYSYSYNDLYDSNAYWRDGEGAVGLDLFRLNSGATEVYLQIATSRSQAITCGQVTGQACFPVEFMDGNRFRVTETTTVGEGIEVQHSPYGTYVITVAARNTARGKQLDVGIGDLIDLVQDRRLRLPPR